MIGGAAPDISLYRLTNNAWHTPPFVDTSGRTVVSPAITSGEKTGVLMVLGQSQAGNTGSSAYTCAQARAHQLNVHDGIVYACKDPVLGSSGGQGSWGSRLADDLIVNGVFTRVILVPAALAGSKVSEWTSSGHLLQYPRVAFLRIREKGWIGHPDVRFGILWEQGTGDTDAGTSQAAYQASWQEMRAAIDALGFTGKWFVAQESLTAGGVTSAAVRAAQAALVDNVRVFALGDTDALGGANRQVDGIHFSDAGNAAVATLFRPAIAAQYP